MLIATEKINRVAVALGGAAIMLILGATDAEHAFFSEESGIDWNVIFLLLGIMLIVGVLKQIGLFEYVAIWPAKKARGCPRDAGGRNVMRPSCARPDRTVRPPPDVCRLPDRKVLTGIGRP